MFHVEHTGWGQLKFNKVLIRLKWERDIKTKVTKI